MSIDKVQDISKPVNPYQDPVVSPGHQDQVDKELQVAYESVRTSIEDMLKFNFEPVKELLAQIAAIHPYRPDMAFAKNPDIAIQDSNFEVKSQTVSPVSTTASESVAAKFKMLENMLLTQDSKIQRVYDQLALSRSARKPELQNLGREFARIKSYINQAEVRLDKIIAHLPEGTMQDDFHQTNLLEDLNQFDAGFQMIHDIIEQMIKDESK